MWLIQCSSVMQFSEKESFITTFCNSNSEWQKGGYDKQQILTCTAMYKPGMLNDSNIISERHKINIEIPNSTQKPNMLSAYDQEYVQVLACTQTLHFYCLYNLVQKNETHSLLTYLQCILCFLECWVEVQSMKMSVQTCCYTLSGHLDEITQLQQFAHFNT